MATNRNASFSATISLVHLQVCRELAISLFSSPMLSSLFISFPILASSPMVFSLFVSLGSRQRGLSLSLGSRLFINFFIIIFFIKFTLKQPLHPIYIYLNDFDQALSQCWNSQPVISPFIHFFFFKCLFMATSAPTKRMPSSWSVKGVIKACLSHASLEKAYAFQESHFISYASRCFGPASP